MRRDSIYVVYIYFILSMQEPRMAVRLTVLYLNDQ